MRIEIVGTRRENNTTSTQADYPSLPSTITSIAIINPDFPVSLECPMQIIEDCHGYGKRCPTCPSLRLLLAKTIFSQEGLPQEIQDIIDQEQKDQLERITRAITDVFSGETAKLSNPLLVQLILDQLEETEDKLADELPAQLISLAALIRTKESGEVAMTVDFADKSLGIKRSKIILLLLAIGIFRELLAEPKLQIEKTLEEISKQIETDILDAIRDVT